MRKIYIPHKTFQMYEEGVRTFIHVLKSEENKFIETLKWGEDLSIVDNETKKELSQTFWTLAHFKENPRFYIMIFGGDRESGLFYKRRACAWRLLSAGTYGPIESSYRASTSDSNEDISSRLLAPHTGLLFCTDIRGYYVAYEGNYFILKNDDRPDMRCVSTDVLKLRVDNKEDSQVLHIMSLCPTIYFSPGAG